jgi:hypothetical protein
LPCVIYIAGLQFSFKEIPFIGTASQAGMGKKMLLKGLSTSAKKHDQQVN